MIAQTTSDIKTIRQIIANMHPAEVRYIGAFRIVREHGGSWHVVSLSTGYNKIHRTAYSAAKAVVS